MSQYGPLGKMPDSVVNASSNIVKEWVALSKKAGAVAAMRAGHKKESELQQIARLRQGLIQRAEEEASRVRQQ